MMLETVLRLMTTGGVFVGMIAVYVGMRNNTRQLNAQIFLSFSDRLQTIRHMLRTELLPIWTAELPPEEVARILPGLLQVLHLILELYELREQGYVRPRMWKIWSRNIDRFLTCPIVRSLNDEIRLEFSGHDRFIAWIEERQASVSSVVRPHRRKRF
ncbi:hypothetical protein ABIC35_001434 [Sphingomonas trueperi]